MIILKYMDKNEAKEDEKNKLQKNLKNLCKIFNIVCFLY